MGKQCPLSDSALPSLELLGLLDTLGLNAERLKKTSDFIQVWLFLATPDTWQDVAAV